MDAKIQLFLIIIVNSQKRNTANDYIIKANNYIFQIANK